MSSEKQEAKIFAKQSLVVRLENPAFDCFVA
jgi:hypothetical protein